MIKINMMCGKRNFGSEWINIDGDTSFFHVASDDIYLKDYCKAQSVDLIYCSHGIAYFDREEIIPLLQAWKRVLKPGGVLRLATPNARVISTLLCKTFFESKPPDGKDFGKWELSDLSRQIFSFDLDKVLGPLYGKMKLGSQTIYHKTVYDFNDLCHLLNECGFCGVDTYDHTKTDHAQFDDHSAAYVDGLLISLNVECYA